MSQCLPGRLVEPGSQSFILPQQRGCGLSTQTRSIFLVRSVGGYVMELCLVSPDRPLRLAAARPLLADHSRQDAFRRIHALVIDIAPKSLHEDAAVVLTGPRLTRLDEVNGSPSRLARALSSRAAGFRRLCASQALSGCKNVAGALNGELL